MTLTEICPHCDGTGLHRTEAWSCSQCGATGRVDATLTEADMLLRAVLETPEDDAPRLIYADWLEEHGEPERAEFIRVQCKLARWSDHKWAANHAELLRREHELLHPPAGHYVGHRYGDGINDGWFEYPFFIGYQFTTRGFVSHITLTEADFFQHAEAIFRQHPIERVTLSDNRIWPSGGNDTYYVGNLGQFPQEFWRSLENCKSRQAAIDAVSAACVRIGRRRADLSTN